MPYDEVKDKYRAETIDEWLDLIQCSIGVVIVIICLATFWMFEQSSSLKNVKNLQNGSYIICKTIPQNCETFHNISMFEELGQNNRWSKNYNIR